MTSLQTDQTQIKLEFIEKQEKLALRHFPTEDQKLQCSKNQSSGPRACWTECQKLCEFFEKSNRRTDEGKVASSELFRGHEKFITQTESLKRSFGTSIFQMAKFRCYKMYPHSV